MMKNFLAKATFYFTLSVIGVVALMAPNYSWAQYAVDISLDPASPPFVPPNSAADIFRAPPVLPAIITAAQLGLPSGADVTAFSYENDRRLDGQGDPNSFYYIRLFYSVTRASVGVPLTPVALQAAPPGNGAAGDVFWLPITTTVPPLPPIVGAPALYIDAFLPLSPPPRLGLGLIPLPGTESELDGLESPAPNHANIALGAFFLHPVFFTVDAATAAGLPVVPPATPATVLYKAGPPPITVYATPAQLGLVPGDVIDALAVQQRGGGGDVIGVGDIVYISLAPGSPSAGPPANLGTATVIRAYPGPPVVQITAAQLGLLPTDDVDAIASDDPGDTQNFRIINKSGDIASGLHVTFAGASGDLSAKVLVNPDACGTPAITCTGGNTVNLDWGGNCVPVGQVVIIRVTTANAPPLALAINSGEWSFVGGPGPIAINVGAHTASIAVPTVSQWGLVIMTLALLTAATIIFARRRPASAHA